MACSGRTLKLVLAALFLLSWGGIPAAPPDAVAPPGRHQAPDTDALQGSLVGYDEGFFIRSADGKNELTIEGLFQFVGGAFDAGRDPRTNFVLKRMRPQFGAKLAGWIRMNLEPNFNEEGLELEEAWLGADLLHGNARLMLGRMKVPFNLEEVRTRRFIDFPRFSILNQFAPAEDHGVFWFATSSSKIWEYNFAVYNGTGSSDTNGSKDLAARLMVHPFAARPSSPWENLQIGVAGTSGRQDTDVGGDEIKNEAGQPVIRYAADARLDGERQRIGIEGAYFRGPWFVQAEAMVIQQEMATAVEEAKIQYRGFYVDVSRVLTGEAKSFKGVVPSRPCDPLNGTGPGAWILAVRLSRLDPDDELARLGFVESGLYSGRVNSISVGLNWVLNTHAILRNSFIHSSYENPITLHNREVDSENALLIEAQMHF